MKTPKFTKIRSFMRLIERPPFVGGRFDFNEVISEISSLGKLEEVTKINEAQYLYWDKWKFRARDWKLDPQKLWYYVKTLRSSHITIPFLELPGLPLRLNVPSVIQRHLHELDLGLRSGVQDTDFIPKESRGQYLIDSLMEEAIASSQLEGAMTSRQVAKQMLESNRRPTNHSEQMIQNNYLGMRWSMDHKDVDITPELIKELHFILTQKTLSRKEGEGTFRISDDIHVIDVQTGSVVYTPPPCSRLDGLMREFCLLANNSRDNDPFLHPITKAIILHFLIGYLHPFVDGNGRTARALFYWYLIKNGYWQIEYLSISRIFLVSKAQYARAYQYTEFDQNDLTYFVLYNLKAIDIAMKNLKKDDARTRREMEDLVSVLNHADLNQRQIRLLQEVLTGEKHEFTVSEVERRLSVSNQTARTDLNVLVDKGFLKHKKMGKKIVFQVNENGFRRVGLK